VRVFQFETGSEDGGACDKHSDRVICVSSSADGRMIASGSQDDTVKVWDAMTGSCVQTLLGHSNWVRSVVFSPDSSLLASGSSDETIRVWSLHDYSMITTLTGHKFDVCCVQFSPNGRRIVSISDDKEIIIWDVEKWTQLARSSSRIRRNLDIGMSFSIDVYESCVVLRVLNAVERWNVLPCTEASPEHTTELSDSATMLLPMIMVPIPDEADINSYASVEPCRYSDERGWIMDEQNRRLCWIPADSRICSDLRGYSKKVILGTTSGRVVIVDLSDI